MAKTCLICNELKDAKHFNVMKGGYLQSYCHKCTNTHYRPAAQKHQEKALEAATSHRERWSDQEIEKVLEMAAEGFPARVIALSVGRTVYAVQTIRQKHQDKA